jgi:hypothetical protein
VTAAEAQARLLEIIVAEAGEPRRSESDGQMAEGRDLRELIAAAKLTPTLVPRAGGGWGRVRMAAVKFPGASPR